MQPAMPRASLGLELDTLDATAERTRVVLPAQRGNWSTSPPNYLNAATRAACSAMTRALSRSSVPATSPLIVTLGLDHTGKRGQPPQLSLSLIICRHLVPLT